MSKKVKLKESDMINRKKLGKLIISPTGLRRMANAIQKKYKTKDDVKIDTFMCQYPELKTIGIVL